MIRITESKHDNTLVIFYLQLSQFYPRYEAYDGMTLKRANLQGSGVFDIRIVAHLSPKLRMSPIINSHTDHPFYQQSLAVVQIEHSDKCQP